MSKRETVLPVFERAETEPTGTYSKLVTFEHPTPTQSVELLPGTQLVLDLMCYTVLKGEQDFQPYEYINLLQNGERVAVGQVTTYSHHRMSDITEVNFLTVAYDMGGDDLQCLSAKEMTKEFIESTEATFLLSGDPHNEADNDEDDLYIPSRDEDEDI